MKLKNVNQILIVSITTFAMLIVFSAFTITTTETFVSSKITTELADNSCTLYVKTSYGSVAKSVKVTTYVSGGISCAGGRDFYTNSDGKATLKWAEGCYLKTIYVDGREYDVNYKDGKTYYLTMK